MYNYSSRLTIKNQPADILAMADWLRLVFNQNNLPTDLLYKLDLCANEAVTNIISYAFDDAVEHKITINFSENDSNVSLEIIDNGKPFNPLEKTPHIQPKTIEAANIGGLGIDLMRHYMDACCYKRTDDKNVLTIMFDKECN